MKLHALSISSTRFWISDSDARKNWKSEAIRGIILPRCWRPVSVSETFQLS